MGREFAFTQRIDHLMITASCMLLVRAYAPSAAHHGALHRLQCQSQCWPTAEGFQSHGMLVPYGNC